MARFLEIFEDATKKGRKIPKEEYLLEGLYPIIDQGQQYIAGFSNDATGLYTDVPAIIFGDHTRILKYVDIPFFLGADGVKLLRAKIPNANYKYLYYALCHAHIPNTGYNRHFKWLKQISLTLPEASTQEEIVYVLDKIDDLIHLRKQQLDKLDQLVKSRFVEMFGDPTVNEKGWPIIPLEAVTTIITYSLTVRPEYQEVGIDLISAKELHKGYVDYSNAPKISAEDYNKLSDKAKPQKYDILFSKTGSIGHCAVISENRAFAITQNAARIGLHFEKVNPLWLLHYLRMDFIQNWCKEHAKGNAVKDFQLQDMKMIPLFDCSMELQDQFAAFVAQVDKSKLTIQQGLDKLETLRTSLMQQYF